MANWLTSPEQKTDEEMIGIIKGIVKMYGKEIESEEADSILAKIKTKRDKNLLFNLAFNYTLVALDIWRIIESNKK